LVHLVYNNNLIYI